MKVLTVLGTRPEIIRLSRTIPLLDQDADHVLVHTGQNYDPDLNEIFFDELKVRSPDHYLGCKGSPMEQIGQILKGCETLIEKERPDRLLILGDTNSGLAAFVGKRMGVPVFHMEAGNRCYDDRVPEEVNRRVIDHSSDVLMPYTERSRTNLLREGIPPQRTFVTGNPIFEVIEHYRDEIASRSIMEGLGLKKASYFLVTLHRAENVDVDTRLRNFVEAFNALCEQYDLPLVWSVHPRTKQRLERLGLELDQRIIMHRPFGLFDFIKLEMNARCVLTDSGTVQEECCIFKVPNVTLRDVTERPETIEVGSNILSGSDPGNILRCAGTVMGRDPCWEPPREYLVQDVSNTVRNIILGY